MERFDARREDTRRPRDWREHELFDEAVSDVALAARDVGHALLFVEFDDRLGEIEVDGAALVRRA